MKNGIILARVSTAEQEKQGLSIKYIQLPKLEQYAKDNGIEVAPEHVFVFQETAARKLRKRFNEVIELVRNSPELVAIIGFRVDRITRNFRDAVAMDDLRIEYKKELHFVDDRLILTSKSFGRDLQDWDMKVFLAKQHINRCQEDSNNTLMSRLESGETYGKAPYGYENAKEEVSDRRTVNLLPFESGIVKKIFELYATGTYSMEQIRTKLKTDHGLNIHKSKLDKILGNPYYYGMRNFKGKLYPHIYPTIITEELFNTVQDIKAGRTKKPAKLAGKPFIYRGLIICGECGCSITPEPHTKKQKNGNIHNYVYYHCTQSKGKHNAAWIEEQELTQQFAEIFRGMSLPKEQLDWMINSLQGAHEGKRAFNETLFDEYNSQIKRFQTMIEKAYEDKLQDRITQEEYDNYHHKFRTQQAEFKQKLERLDQADEDYYITASYILELTSRSYELFIGSEMGQKRELIQLVVQNLSFKDGKLSYDLQKPFDSILISEDRSKWGERRDSNPQPSVPQTDAPPLSYSHHEAVGFYHTITLAQPPW